MKRAIPSSTPPFAGFGMLLSTVLSLLAMEGRTQDTFSIVAVDPLTGEIGSAGASCLNDGDIPGGVLIISDLIPGIGAIHTQSYWQPANQSNAHSRMMEGYSPQEIIDWLVLNDFQGNPTIRQYGIVDFTEAEPRSAAYTGTSCFDVKEHITGPGYSIQGNILLNDQIIDGMEAAFLLAEGSLADKLMAAMQGANIPGADSRCLEEGISSQSAFLRVARPDDEADDLYLDLAVTQTPYGVEPIDSLQVLFDEWTANRVHSPMIPATRIFPNPAGAELNISGPASDFHRYELRDLRGALLRTGGAANSAGISLLGIEPGALLLILFNNKDERILQSRIIVQ